MILINNTISHTESFEKPGDSNLIIRGDFKSIIVEIINPISGYYVTYKSRIKKSKSYHFNSRSYSYDFSKKYYSYLITDTSFEFNQTKTINSLKSLLKEYSNDFYWKCKS